MRCVRLLNGFDIIDKKLMVHEFIFLIENIRLRLILRQKTFLMNIGRKRRRMALTET